MFNKREDGTRKKEFKWRENEAPIGGWKLVWGEI